VHSARRIDALVRPEKALRPAVKAVLGGLREAGANIAAGFPGEGRASR
jgi:hypothetical protein